MRTERRYLEAQRWILALAVVALVMVLLDRIFPPPAGVRAVVVEARGCWDRDMRAILHRDGTVECRP